MPMYQYKCRKCECHFDAVATVATRTKPKPCHAAACDGTADRVFDCPGAAAPGIWPAESIGMGVLPEQVAEATAQAKRHGIAAEYKPDGTAVVRDRTARKQLMRLKGMFDKVGGYGD